MWCALKGKILSRTELLRKGVLRLGEDIHCTLCGSREKDVDHLFATYVHGGEMALELFCGPNGSILGIRWIVCEGSE